MQSIERQTLEVDIACAGFGPATGGFLTTLAPALADRDGRPGLQSRAMPGLPLQVICYERADDVGFGVSGVVTRARGLRASLPELDPSQIPMACPVHEEQVFYLLDPAGASRRSAGVRALDACIGSMRWMLSCADHAVRLPFLPGFLRKDGGLLLSLGQFNQWVSAQLMGTGLVQVWPGLPVAAPIVENDAVVGLQLADQGTDRAGNPDAGFMPGMAIRAALTVVGDGGYGPVGRQLDERFGLPPGHHRGDWAIGMKMVVDLPAGSALKPGTVLHTLGYPEPEIFGFLYVHPDNVASLGIFVPSWLQSPVRTGYRYLQHWMRHPALWRHLDGAAMRSWGAKSLQESGARGEPWLAGPGYARIGEGSGSTNVLTGSGVDEAWTTGAQLAEGVIELLRAGEPFTRANLERTYVARRRASWVEREGRVAAYARDGFQRGFLTGLFGMGLAGMTGGRLHLHSSPPASGQGVPSAEDYYRGRIAPEQIARIRAEAAATQTPLHEALMRGAGWPEIPYDGKLLVSHQDALLLGGKVQAPAGFADHVVFLDAEVCQRCAARLCVEICSGQAIKPGEDGAPPQFDREKCVHCGACMWSCTTPGPEGRRGNVEFRAGAGGLHSAVN